MTVAALDFAAGPSVEDAWEQAPVNRADKVRPTNFSEKLFMFKVLAVIDQWRR